MRVSFFLSLLVFPSGAEHRPKSRASSLGERGKSPLINSECKASPAGRAAGSGKCVAQRTCHIGQVRVPEVLGWLIRFAEPSQGPRVPRAARESRTPPQRPAPAPPLSR